MKGRVRECVMSIYCVIGGMRATVVILWYCVSSGSKGQW